MANACCFDAKPGGWHHNRSSEILFVNLTCRVRRATWKACALMTPRDDGVLTPSDDAGLSAGRRNVNQNGIGMGKETRHT